MRPASYRRRIRMVIEITSTIPAFFAVVDSIVAHKDKDHIMVIIN
jgi:hypothetical protein